MKRTILFSALVAIILSSLSGCVMSKEWYDCETCDAKVYKEGVATGQTLYRQDSLLKYTKLLFQLEALKNYAWECRGRLAYLTREDVIVLKNVKDMLVGNEKPVSYQSNNPKDWNHRIDSVDFGDVNKNLPIGQRVKNVYGYMINIVLEHDRDFTTMGEILVKKDNCMMSWSCDRNGDVWGLYTYNMVNGTYMRSLSMFRGHERIKTEVEELIDDLYRKKVLGK